MLLCLVIRVVVAFCRAIIFLSAGLRLCANPVLERTAFMFSIILGLVRTQNRTCFPLPELSLIGSAVLSLVINQSETSCACRH